jgi:hypothetical protein
VTVAIVAHQSMETRRSKRSKVATSEFGGVSLPAERVDGRAAPTEDSPPAPLLEEHLPEAAGVGRMVLRPRPARVETRRSNRVKPPVEQIDDAVSAEDSARLLQALQALPEAAWLGTTRGSEGFATPECSWIELRLPRGAQAVEVPDCLAGDAVLVQKCVQGLVTASRRVQMGRCSINRYMPSGRHKPKQWVLRPHCDQGVVSMTLSLRPRKSKGGALVVSAVPSGDMDFLSHRPNTVCTRRNKVKEYQQGQGQVLRFDGSNWCHFVKSTARACRYTLTVLMQ